MSDSLLLSVQMSDKYIKSSAQPHCSICGRFASAVRDYKGKIVRNSDGSVAGWYFSCVIYDSYMGAWEHE